MKKIENRFNIVMGLVFAICMSFMAIWNIEWNKGEAERQARWEQYQMEAFEKEQQAIDEVIDSYEPFIDYMLETYYE